MTLRATLWKEVEGGWLTPKHPLHAEHRVQLGSTSCPLASSIFQPLLEFYSLPRELPLLWLSGTNSWRRHGRDFLPPCRRDGFWGGTVALTCLYTGQIASNWIIARRQHNKLCLLRILQGVFVGSCCVQAKSWQRMGK